MKVAATGPAPFFVQSSNSSYSGIDLDIVNIWASKFNFELDIETDTHWLDFDYDTFRYTGVVGSVHHGNATIAISETTFIGDGFALADYIFTYNFPIVYMSAKPKRLPPFMNLTKPFALSTWIAIVVTSFVVMIIFGTICKYFTNSTDIIANALVIYKIQLNQSLPNKESWNRVSISMFVLVWNVYALIVISSFAGNLEAYFMIADNEKPIDQIEDAVEQVNHLVKFCQAMPPCIIYRTDGYTFHQATALIMYIIYYQAQLLIFKKLCLK